MIHHNLDKLYVFLIRKYSNLAVQTAIKWKYAWDFKTNISKYAVHNWLYRTLLSKTLFALHSNFPLIKLQALCYLIAPSGAVIFISNLYPGSFSDKEIVHRSGFAKWRTLGKNDSIMADRGILISNDLESIGVSFNISAFLNGSDQLTKAEVKESQAIASVRIYVASNTACKKATSNQEWNPINSSWLNKSNVDSLCLIT